MQRRGFLAGILANFAPPSIVRAGSIMRIDTRIAVPLYMTSDIVTREALRILHAKLDFAAMLNRNYVESAFRGHHGV